MDLKSALNKEFSFPRWMVLTAAFFLMVVLSLMLIIEIGPLEYGGLLVAVIGVGYITSTPRFRTFTRQLRPNPRSIRSRIRKEGMTAAEFLGWAMDRHRAMERFRATAEIDGHGGGRRYISYERPNKYRIASEYTNGHSLTSVCDGARVVEYSVPPTSEARSFPAPESISVARSMFMMHPMFCGSLFNRFFAGAGGLNQLADLTKGSIEYGSEESVEGELCRLVVFYGVEMYGNTSALIGTQTGRVHRIRYDSEPLTEVMKSPAYRAQMLSASRANIAKEKDPAKRAELEKLFEEYSKGLDQESFARNWTAFRFRDIEVDGSFPASNFDTTPPGNVEVVPHDSGPRLPVPVGEPAPDAKVCDLEGKEIKLSDFRGKVLLIDLWATWCGPCRKGLPDTASLAKEGRSEGFEVLAVSNEDPEMIREFLREEDLQDLPAYIDANDDLWKNYNVSSIPTVIIIDADGNLAEYLVGLRPVEQLRSAIDKARRS